MKLQDMPFIGTVFDVASAITGVGQQDRIEQNQQYAKNEYGWDDQDIKIADLALRIINSRILEDRASKVEGAPSGLFFGATPRDRVEDFFENEIGIPRDQEIIDYLVSRDENAVEHLIDHAQNMSVSYRAAISDGSAHSGQDAEDLVQS